MLPIEWVAGLDWTVLAGVDANSSASVVVKVSGWDWWLLSTLDYSLTAGVAMPNVTPLYTIAGQNRNLWTWSSASSYAPGTVVEVSGGIGGSTTSGLGPTESSSLPWAPVVGEGSVSLGFIGGGALSRVTGATVMIVGRILRNRKQ